MPELYKAQEVDAILKDTTGSMVELMQSVQDLSDENQTLKEANRRLQTSNVELEKVASTKSNLPELDNDKLNAFVSQLISEDYVDAENREKIASRLAKDPNDIISLASKILTMSSTNLNEGRGIPKQASVSRNTNLPDGWEEDGWDAVIGV